MELIYLLVAVMSGMILGPLMFLAGFKTGAIIHLSKQTEQSPPVVANLSGVMLDANRNPFTKVETPK